MFFFCEVGLSVYFFYIELVSFSLASTVNIRVEQQQKTEGRRQWLGGELEQFRRQTIIQSSTETETEIEGGGSSLATT